MSDEPKPEVYSLDPAELTSPEVRALCERIGLLLADAGIMPSRAVGVALTHLGTEVLKDQGGNTKYEGDA